MIVSCAVSVSELAFDIEAQSKAELIGEVPPRSDRKAHRVVGVVREVVLAIQLSRAENVLVGQGCPAEGQRIAPDSLATLA